jgi:peptide/nickel transport system permease protein
MTIAADSTTEFEALERPRAGWLSRTWQFSRRNPLGAAGALVIVVMFVMAALADFIAPYDPLANAYDRLHQSPAWRTGSAPTSTAATCSRASSTARAPR